MLTNTILLNRPLASAIGVLQLCLFAQPAHTSTISLDRSGEATAAQSGIYRVHRDIFRNGGHGWKERSPVPYGDGYNYGDVALDFALSSLIPPGSSIESALLTWNFNNLMASTDSTVPEYDRQYGNALAPRVHGSDLPCQGQPCSPAKLQRWSPEATFWSSRVTLAGDTHWFADGRHSSGSINLLDLWSSDQLLNAGNLTFYGTVQYGMGRPYFDTEGWNADTEFYVFGSARVNADAHLQLQFTPVPPPSTPHVPEPSTYVLVGAPLLVVGLLRRRRTYQETR